MGFDNESILNIQSLPGEYFCPVCRQLVYPNEAIQTQCTHLYCKPCLTYVLGTTRACPYDGYLVTDSDSRGLQEANPSLAEAIGRVAVHCLYHKSGCTWQGPLSDSTVHGNGCPYGSSPVVCNRCGTQIVHRQVQEHAQNCPGTQGQMQPQENAQQAQGAAVAAAPVAAAATPYEQNQVVQAAGQQYSAQTGLQVPQAPVSQAPSYGMGQDQLQGNLTIPQQGAAQSSAPDQWYHQQYQQYYQQYPQYDQYQQYQQYDQYQQQAQIQAQQQPQPQAQPQVQPQPQPQPQPQVQTQPQPHPHAQPQSLEAHTLAQGVHTPQPYQQMERQGQAAAQPQQVQPQQQIMPSQPHQLMPNQSQQVPMQQHAIPIPSHQQPALQPHQHSLQMPQQFPSPQQQPQMHQQMPSPQQPQMQQQQQQPSLLPQQPPHQHQQPHMQQQTHPHPHQHQQMMHQPPPQQQLMLQQQILPAHSLPPQMQQPAQGAMQHPLQQYPLQQQQQQVSHQSLQQPQQQTPFFPQPMQSQQFLQSQIPPASQQHPQVQPAFQQGLQPPQGFPQNYTQNVGHMNGPQQPGGRPPLAQNHGMIQQPFQQAQGRPLHPPYSQPMRAPNRASQASTNQVATPNQTYMPRPGHRAHLPPHQQRPPAQQSNLPRPSSQTALMPGSAGTQSMRNVAQNVVASGAPKVAPESEKPPETVLDKTSNLSLLQTKHALQPPTKIAQSSETNDTSGQNNVAETVKADNSQPIPDLKSIPNEMPLANEKPEQKNMSTAEPAKSEVSDSSQQQVSTKDSQMQKQDGNSQQPTSQKCVQEDIPEKTSQIVLDGTSQEPSGQAQDSSSEHARHRQDGNLQPLPRQVQEGPFHQAHEARRVKDEKVQQAALHTQDTQQWQDGNASQQHSQGQDRSLQHPLRPGLVQGQDKNLQQPLRPGPVQGQDRNLQQPLRQGSLQAQDKNLPPPPRQGPVQGLDRNLPQHPRQGPVQGLDRNLPQHPRQGPVHGQDRNLFQPSRQGLVQGQNRNLQQSLRQGQDRTLQQPLHRGSMQGQDGTLQQPLQHERTLQQVPLQAQVQGQERFQQPPREGQLQGQQLPYLGQSQAHDRNFQQLPHQGHMQNISEQFQLSSSKQAAMPQMPSQLQPGSSSSMPSLERGHGQMQSKNFDLMSPAHLQSHHSAQLHAQHMGPRSSQGESMLGLPPSLPSGMAHHLSSFDGPRGFMERGLQFGQTNTLQQSPLSKPMDRPDILANKRPEIPDNKQNEPQQMLGPSRFSMLQSTGFQANIMKTNGGTSKGYVEGIPNSAFPPGMMEEGLKSRPQDPSRQISDRKEFQDTSRKYKPGQFDGQLLSNSDDLFPSMRHQKGHSPPTSKFDQMPSIARPHEMGSHGFLPDAHSKYQFDSSGSPAGGPSRLFPPYQSIGSFPASSGGPSMFSSDIGDGSRLPGPREDMMGRRPDSTGMRPDYLGDRSDFTRARPDHLPPPRSPGKDYMGLSSGRVNIGPSVGFGSGITGSSHISRPIEDLSRDPLGFDEQRNKPFGFHSSAMHNAFQPGQHQLGMGNRLPPFHSSGPAPGGPGPLPNHMMISEPGTGFGANIPMQGFPGESGFLKTGQISNDIEPLDLGRKRKPGSTGWCRICQIDCYTVEGLDQHSQTREHQKMAMDMVLSIKQDNAKKQKHSTDDQNSQENGNKVKRSGFEARGTRR
eukprot:Gb_01281 [translate_table: standard]